MGSTGYGRFGDYPRGTDGLTSDTGSGGAFFVDLCPNELSIIKVEDINHFDYYRDNKTVPPKGDKVIVSGTIDNSRIVVLHVTSNKIIGSIPTDYNRYLQCFIDNEYAGEVVNSGLFPIPFVVVNVKKNA